MGSRKAKCFFRSFSRSRWNNNNCSKYNRTLTGHFLARGPGFGQPWSRTKRIVKERGRRRRRCDVFRNIRVQLPDINIHYCRWVAASFSHVSENMSRTKKRCVRKHADARARETRFFDFRYFSKFDRNSCTQPLVINFQTLIQTI